MGGQEGTQVYDLLQMIHEGLLVLPQEYGDHRGHRRILPSAHEEIWGHNPVQPQPLLHSFVWGGGSSDISGGAIKRAPCFLWVI